MRQSVGGDGATRSRAAGWGRLIRGHAVPDLEVVNVQMDVAMPPNMHTAQGTASMA